MMRTSFILATLYLGLVHISAQDIEVKKFELHEIDQMAATNYRHDNNGNPCALLIVQSLKDRLEFEGWVVGDVKREDDAYWVFIANGAKHIKIKHADFQTKDVVFGDYGVISLKGGQSYSLQLEDDTKDIVNKVYRLGWNLNKMKVPNNVQTVLKMAATRGDVKAQKAMAQLSLGKAVRTDELDRGYKGIHWIEKLLEKGDSTCLDSMPGELMYLYANKLKEGLHRGSSRVGIDEEKSIYTSSSLYNLKACLKGYKLAGHYLFVDYPLSKGLTEYRKDIIRICKDSASVNNSMAMSCLGYIYEKGICEQINLEEAAKWFYKANETDPSKESKTNLCRVYGNKLFPIDKESFDFIKKESEEGLKEALFQLGYMYEEGRNVPKDINLAMDYYLKASPENYYTDRHAKAACRLAEIYYNQKEYKIASKFLTGIDDDDALYLGAIIDYYQYDYTDNRIKVFNTLNNLSKKGYQKATEFIKNNY
jgi:TPR repeat protein